MKDYERARIEALTEGDPELRGLWQEHLDFERKLADLNRRLAELSPGMVEEFVNLEALRDVMAKGCRLELHPRAAGAGFCAQTPMAQVGVLLHQVDDAPVYDLLVYSGFARAFWHWLSGAAAEFGLAATVEKVG